MDSTIFNRRALLGSGALVGLGALLAACGQQANNEAAATASAAPLPSRVRRLKMVESIEDTLLASVTVCYLVASQTVIHRSN